MMPWRNTAIMLTTMLVVGCGGPPQMGPDREAFQAVDAMFTAVSLREVGQLERSLSRLKALEDSGRLPASASRELTEIAQVGRDGEWETAQVRLRAFMRGQRR